MKKNYITIIRVLSMIAVVIGHLFSSSNISFIKSLGQFCYIGVMLFFFISGFLYGTKSLNNSFITNRIKKVFLPELIFSIIVLLLYLCIGFVSQTVFIKYLFVYLFNVQYFFEYLYGIGHLWFISIIMICYLITALVSKNDEKIIILIICLLMLFSFIFLYISPSITQLFIYITVYMVGYLYGKKHLNKVSKNISVIICCILIVFSICIRVVFKYYLDDTSFYNIVIVNISNFVCGIAIFKVLKKLFNNDSDLPRILTFLDNYSYYIYIVHYIFVIGPLSLMNVTNNYVFNCIIVAFLSILLAYAYKIVLNCTLFYLISGRRRINERYNNQ